MITNFQKIMIDKGAQMKLSPKKSMPNFVKINYYTPQQSLKRQYQNQLLKKFYQSSATGEHNRPESIRELLKFELKGKNEIRVKSNQSLYMKKQYQLFKQYNNSIRDKFPNFKKSPTLKEIKQAQPIWKPTKDSVEYYRLHHNNRRAQTTKQKTRGQKVSIKIQKEHKGSISAMGKPNLVSQGSQQITQEDLILSAQKSLNQDQVILEKIQKRQQTTKANKRIKIIDEKRDFLSQKQHKTENTETQMSQAPTIETRIFQYRAQTYNINQIKNSQEIRSLTNFKIDKVSTNNIKDIIFQTYKIQQSKKVHHTENVLRVIRNKNAILNHKLYTTNYPPEKHGYPWRLYFGAFKERFDQNFIEQENELFLKRSQEHHQTHHIKQSQKVLKQKIKKVRMYKRNKQRSQSSSNMGKRQQQMKMVSNDKGQQTEFYQQKNQKPKKVVTRTQYTATQDIEFNVNQAEIERAIKSSKKKKRRKNRWKKRKIKRNNFLGKTFDQRANLLVQQKYRKAKSFIQPKQSRINVITLSPKKIKKRVKPTPRSTQLYLNKFISQVPLQEALIHLDSSNFFMQRKMHNLSTKIQYLKTIPYQKYQIGLFGQPFKKWERRNASFSELYGDILYKQKQPKVKPPKQTSKPFQEIKMPIKQQQIKIIPVQKAQNVQNVQNVQNFQNVQNIQKQANSQEEQKLTSISNLQPISEMTSSQNIQTSSQNTGDMLVSSKTQEESNENYDSSKVTPKIIEENEDISNSEIDEANYQITEKYNHGKISKTKKHSKK